MDPKPLTPGLAVPPQITAADMSAICDAGFKAIVCNRPNGEGADQPGFEEIRAAAEHGRAFGKSMAALSKPLLAYGRTGTRPTLARYLEERILPPLSWFAIPKVREWLAKPEMVG